MDDVQFMVQWIFLSNRPMPTEESKTHTLKKPTLHTCPRVDVEGPLNY